MDEAIEEIDNWLIHGHGVFLEKKVYVDFEPEFVTIRAKALSQGMNYGSQRMVLRAVAEHSRRNEYLVAWNEAKSEIESEIWSK